MPKGSHLLVLALMPMFLSGCIHVGINWGNQCHTAWLVLNWNEERS